MFYYLAPQFSIDMQESGVAIKPLKQKFKLHHIDQLRGIAILLVMVTHVSHSQINISDISRVIFDFGKIGVELFFFLSAYTLCLSMTIRKEGEHVNYYYIRRYFRIAPLYYIGIILYFIVSKYDFLNQGGNLSHHENFTFSNIFFNITFLHGLVPSANNTIVPGGWSIGTEMLFYVVFPVLFHLYQRFKSTLYLVVAPLIGLIVACIFVYIIASLIGNRVYSTPFYFYHILNQLPVFLIGMTYFFLEQNGRIRINPTIGLTLFFILFGLSFILMHKLKSDITIALFIAALSFGLLFNFFKEIKLNLSILQRIGQLSFSIYIFHFVFAYPLTDVFLTYVSSTVHPYLLFLISFVMTLLLSVFLAALSERYLEKPGINLGKTLIEKLTKRNSRIVSPQ